MKIHDITQELFSCTVFPGDVSPVRETAATISESCLYNLTNFSMCAHNGTHVDAPFHFYKDGKTVDQLSLDKLIGRCYVGFAEGAVTAEVAEALVEKARKLDPEAAKRILIGGDAYVTLEAAEVFVREGVVLVGNESQTVGPFEAPAAVHYALLRAEVVLLEGIRLGRVAQGVYLLNAAPINLGGCDGAPCRAVLLEI